MLLKSLCNYSIRNLCSSAKALKVGDSVTVVKTVTEKDLKVFSELSGDTNPIHNTNTMKEAVVHGALLNSFVSGIIGTKLPGPGTLVVSQNINFPNKCFANESVTIKVELIELRKLIKVKFICEVEDGKKVVMYGDAKLIMKRE